jgi:hypothetical protein
MKSILPILAVIIFVGALLTEIFQLRKEVRELKVQLAHETFQADTCTEAMISKWVDAGEL